MGEPRRANPVPYVNGGEEKGMEDIQEHLGTMSLAMLLTLVVAGGVVGFPVAAIFVLRFVEGVLLSIAGAAP